QCPLVVFSHFRTLVCTPTPVQTPTPAWTETPVQTPTAVGTPTRVQTLTPVQIPTRVRTPTPIRTPTLARIPAPTSFPVGVPITAVAPAWESLGNSAPPLDPPSESAPEPPVWPDKDLSPTPSVKHFPSVANEFGSVTQESLPALTPTAADFLGPTLGSTSRADSSATKLMDSTPDSIPAPILETDSFATAFTSTFENLPEDSKILIRVIYCGL
uniref:Selenoprotein V n=1 Tax=Lynx canadensis TaxID=61383 RepID=A0A667J1Y5_LYNCA